MKPRAELFDIATKKDDQRRHEMAMTPEERVLLCLKLTALTWSINKEAFKPLDDGIEWIELGPSQRHG